MKLLLTRSIGAPLMLVAIAADAPYMGKWTLNTTESDIAAVTMKISKDASGEFTEVDNGVLTSQFKMDGKDYPTAMGLTATWKQLDDNSWQVVYKVNEKVQEIDTLRLSQDGRTLTQDAKTSAPDGKANDMSFVFQRVSGGPGLVGEWKGKSANLGENTVFLELTPHGDDGVTIGMPNLRMTCEAKTDGRDYPCKGEGAPAGTTVSFKQTASNSFRLVQKQNGKTVASGDNTVSQDGNSMTGSMEWGEPGQGGTKMKVAYDRVRP
jgi:hypothetical protein